MRVLFLSLTYSTVEHKSFYETLLQQFVSHGHEVYVACAKEKRDEEVEGLEVINGIQVLRIGTGNITGNISPIEKGISTLRIDGQFQRAVKKYYGHINFDLILYPTPPITLVNTITSVKRATGAKTYLLLKDIFPQNAVDLGMMKKTGLKGVLYKSFRRKEKKLYQVSDYIGCMSPANVEYVIRHNEFVNRKKVEVCPNSIDIPYKVPAFRKISKGIRKKYNVPDGAVIFLYGGNLGKPQGIDFLVKALYEVRNNPKAFFMIVGAGAQKYLLEEYIRDKKPKNAILLDYMPKDEYQQIAEACDVGLIFLDHRFQIPNYPSRLLAYLTAGVPVLCATDPNTDIGTIARDNGYGFCCESNDVKAFAKAVDSMILADREQMGKSAWEFFLKNYTTEIGYNIIMKHFEQ